MINVNGKVMIVTFKLTIDKATNRKGQFFPPKKIHKRSGKEVMKRGMVVILKSGRNESYFHGQFEKEKNIYINQEINRKNVLGYDFFIKNS